MTDDRYRPPGETSEEPAPVEALPAEAGGWPHTLRYFAVRIVVLGSALGIFETLRFGRVAERFEAQELMAFGVAMAAIESPGWIVVAAALTFAHAMKQRRSVRSSILTIGLAVPPGAVLFALVATLASLLVGRAFYGGDLATSWESITGLVMLDDLFGALIHSAAIVVALAPAAWLGAAWVRRPGREGLKRVMVVIAALAIALAASELLRTVYEPDEVTAPEGGDVEDGATGESGTAVD